MRAAPRTRANPPWPRAAGTSTRRRRLLDHEQCVELLDLWLEAYAALEALRARPLGRHLRRLPVPTLLSESIAALHCTEILGQPAQASEGIGRHDLHVSTYDGSLDVEVKGTTADWITITRTDRAADLVIWLDFSDLVLHPGGLVVARVYGREVVESLRDRVLAQQAQEAMHLVGFDARAASRDPWGSDPPQRKALSTA